MAECDSCSWGEIFDNAVKATKNAVKHVAEKGFLVVDKSISDARKAICDGCEWKDNLRCKACGCFISVKTIVGSEICPKGKW